MTTDRLIRPGDGTPEADWLGWPGLAALPAVSFDDLLPAGGRAVVVAPHPDDEVLAAGGLLALAADHGREVRVIAATDGTASHAGSTLWPPERLLRERPLESVRALQRLGLSAESIVRLGFPDGGLGALRHELAAKLDAFLQPADLVVTTWRLDGHPDHEACGQAVAAAAERRGARLAEVPVWAWHWARPDDPRMPWRRARRLALDSSIARRKRDAVHSFSSQLAPDPSTGSEPILRATTIARAARPFEIYFL